MEGASVSDISSLKITRSVSGMGTSGISVSCLTFSAPVSSVIYTERIRAPSVIVVGVKSLKTKFWVDKRSVGKGIVTFTCYDFLAFTDRLTLQEEDFINTILSEDTGIDVPAVLVGLQSCVSRLTGISAGFNGNGLAAGCVFDRDALIGQTVSSVLSEIAECALGCWCVDNSNSIQLIRFDGNKGGVSWSTVITNDHTEINEGEPLKIGGINAAMDSGQVYTIKGDFYNTGYIIDMDTYGTMTKEQIDNHTKPILGKMYTYWSVDKAFTDFVPDIGDIFEGHLINNVSAKIDSTGITCSLAANEVTGGEIGRSLGELTRKLNNSVQMGKKCKNMTITAYQGIYFIEENDEA